MDCDIILKIIFRYYPELQAVYLFGSCGTEYERPDSDIDIAVLLPVECAKKNGSLMMSECHGELEEAFKKTVDLVNLRNVSTVFQNEIIHNSRYLLINDKNAVDEFEMYTMSFYQKLNYERREILEEFYKTGRAYNV